MLMIDKRVQSSYLERLQVTKNYFNFGNAIIHLAICYFACNFYVIVKVCNFIYNVRCRRGLNFS